MTQIISQAELENSNTENFAHKNDLKNNLSKCLIQIYISKSGTSNFENVLNNIEDYHILVGFHFLLFFECFEELLPDDQEKYRKHFSNTPEDYILYSGKSDNFTTKDFQELFEYTQTLQEIGNRQGVAIVVNQTLTF